MGCVPSWDGTKALRTWPESKPAGPGAQRLAGSQQRLLPSVTSEPDLKSKRNVLQCVALTYITVICQQKYQSNRGGVHRCLLLLLCFLIPKEEGTAGITLCPPSTTRVLWWLPEGKGPRCKDLDHFGDHALKPHAVHGSAKCVSSLALLHLCVLMLLHTCAVSPLPSQAASGAPQATQAPTLSSQAQNLGFNLEV